jgi:putative hydrolase of HD superfamily
MKRDKKEIKKLIDFYKKAEKLKVTTRHSWLSNPKRQESVAEHSWMLCLLSMLLSDKLDKKIDLLKVMKMMTIHDLAEAVTGDIPAWEISTRQKNKYKYEKEAFKKLIVDLPKNKAKEILSLWKEFEENKTKEAKFANSLDKIEAVMQHNVANISTWDQGDYNASPYYKDEYFNFDSFMRAFRDVVNIQGMEKVIKAKTERRLDKKHLERYKKEKK